MEKEAALFKVLGEATRLRLAALLAANGETCVCRLAAALDAPDFRVSRHLGIMRAAGLVRARRHGTWMYYRLAEPSGLVEEHLHECFRRCLAEHGVVMADMERLAAIGEECSAAGGKGKN